LEATSKKPPIAPETMAWRKNTKDKIRIWKRKEKRKLRSYVLFTLSHLKLKLTLTFKRGMVTVGAAAIAWYPTPMPFASNDWVYGIASIKALFGGLPFLPSTNSAGRPSMTYGKLLVWDKLIFSMMATDHKQPKTNKLIKSKTAENLKLWQLCIPLRWVDHMKEASLILPTQNIFPNISVTTKLEAETRIRLNQLISIHYEQIKVSKGMFGLKI